MYHGIVAGTWKSSFLLKFNRGPTSPPCVIDPRRRRWSASGDADLDAHDHGRRPTGEEEGRSRRT